MRCQSKGCTNPATGLWKAVAAGLMGYSKQFYLCAGCGFTAHSQRTFKVEFDEDTGREYTSFPRRYKMVTLIHTLTEDEYYKPGKLPPDGTDVLALLQRKGRLA